MNKQQIDKERTNLLNYPDLFVSSSGSTEKTYQVFAFPSIYNTDNCPKCYRTHIQERGYHERTIKDYVLDEKQVKIITVKYQQRQFYCVDGNHTFGEDIETYAPFETMSKRLQRYIFFLCCSVSSWAEVARRVGIHFNTVCSVRKRIGTDLRRVIRVDKSPHHIAIGSLRIKGNYYTIIANLDDCTIMFFGAGKPAAVLSKKNNFGNFTIQDLFIEAHVVIVEPKCDYEVELRKIIKPRCSVVVDQKLLCDQLFEDISHTANLHLSGYKSNKFMECLVSPYQMEDQKAFNFLNRVFTQSNELKVMYSAYTGLNQLITGHNDPRNLVMKEDELKTYLVNNGYASANIVTDTLNTRTFNDYYGIDEFRRLEENINKELSMNPGIVSDEVIEDKFFYCIPSTFINHKTLMRHKASCFELDTYYRNELIALGKGFADIEENLRYRKAYIAGERFYEGPDVIN